MSSDGHFIGDEMSMVHKFFRREFLLAADVVRRVRAGDRARTDVVAAHLRLLTTMLHHHHSMEDDAIWPLLEARAPDAMTMHVIAAQEQHQKVASALNQHDARLSSWTAQPTAAAREGLAREIDALTEATLDHMTYEERHVVPLMEEYVTLPEWRACVEAAGAGVSPGDMPVVFGMVMYEADPDLIDVTIASMPAEVRSGIRELAAQAFHDRAVLIHGTATPPRSTELARSVGRGEPEP